MSLLNKIKTGLAALAVSTVGCSSADKKVDYPVWMLPVNMAAGYFGAIATHEAGHAIAGKLAGGRKIDVDVLPVRREGGDHLGYTKVNKGHFNHRENTIFNISGPLANYGAEILSREVLKTGRVPEVVQPTVQWYAVGNKLLGYWEISGGLMRKKDRDLGKENIGISVGFLAAKLAYDIHEILSDDGIFFDALEGKRFYKPKTIDVNLESTGDDVGVFFTKRF